MPDMLKSHVLWLSPIPSPGHAAWRKASLIRYLVLILLISLVCTVTDPVYQKCEGTC